MSVKVSALLFNIAQGTIAGLDLVIEGAGQSVLPTAGIIFDTGITPNLVSAHSFQWMKTNIPAGATEITVINAVTDGGNASMGLRTATIEMCLN
jgi:hypothetical protein